MPDYRFTTFNVQRNLILSNTSFTSHEMNERTKIFLYVDVFHQKTHIMPICLSLNRLKEKLQTLSTQLWNNDEKNTEDIKILNLNILESFRKAWYR